MRIYKRCAECGRRFAAGRSTQRFCSEECRHAAKMQKQRRTRAKARAEERPRKKKEPAPVRVYEKTCPICGGVFSTIHGNAMYCSEACRLNARQNHRSFRAVKVEQPEPGSSETRLVESFGGELLYNICPVCRRPFVGVALGEYGKFCSAECEATGKDLEARRKARAARAEAKKKPAPMTCAECTRCKTCHWYDVADKACNFCAITMTTRGEPVSEACGRYAPKNRAAKYHHLHANGPWMEEKNV